MGASDRFYWTKYWSENEIIHRSDKQSKVGRTIGGVPISDNQWSKTLDYITQLLDVRSQDCLLDLCAGSGVFTDFFSNKVQHVDAVDISETLLSNIVSTNVSVIIGDVCDMDFKHERYDRVLFYFAIQHFNLFEIIGILNRLYQATKSGGIILVGDVPDQARKYAFYNNETRRKAYFDSVLANEPIIGEWFGKEDLMYLAQHIGFSKVEVLDQPAFCMNAHYRFDLKLTK
jgi:ubiquinone/menaquinone biosynthesis C-methylase UbiE